MQTITLAMDEQQGLTVEHGEIHSISCDKPEWKRTWKRMYMNIRMYIGV